MQQQDLVTLTIDGREVSVPRGTTVLHAAEKLGIEIPTFCYSPKMDPLGACRMCLVSIERAKGFPPACATPVAPGMVVHTTTSDVVKTQQGILEFLLINHPLDCPICDKGGECPLQNQTFKYGPGKSRYAEEKRHFVKHLPIGPQIMLDRERCIVCQLCVRYMDDVADDPQIVLISRGGKTEVNVFPDHPFDSPFAGNTIELCPVGALTSRKYRFRARPWDLQRGSSICPSCAVGCNVTLDTRRNDLLRLTARENLAVDDGWLCDYGRFGTLDRLHEGGRITAPLVRRDGVLEESSWEEALAVAAEGLDRARHVGVAALASPRSTNEELYLLGRIFRTALRSADIAVPGASPASTNIVGGAPIEALEHADAIVLLDADPIARQHVLDLRIKKQVKRRETPLIVLANEPTSLDYLASVKAPFDASNVRASIERLTQLLEADAASDQALDVDEKPASTILSAASSIASAAQAALGTMAENLLSAVRPSADPDPLRAVADALRGVTHGVLIYDERLLVGQDVPALAGALQALAARLGTGDGAARHPLALSAAANSRGAAEMGAHGSWLPGGVPATDSDAASRLGKAWGLQPVTSAGRSVPEILSALREGAVHGLFLLDYDPIAEGLPEALRTLEAAPFVVLQASRTSPAATLADVVFPATAYGETTGTLTNLEGRVQRLGVALLPPDEVREGWQVLCDLADALGYPVSYPRAEDVTQEIARVTGLPSWGGIVEQAVEPVLTGGIR